MKLYFDSSIPQRMLGMRSTEQELLMGPFPGATTIFEFDEITNTALMVAASQSPNGVPRVTFVSGAVHIDGAPAIINPDGPTETDRKALPSRKAQIETYMGLNDLPVPPDLSDIAAGSNAAAIVAYINGTLLPRINQLDTLVQRTNANTNAGQGIFQILRYIGTKLGFISS